MKTKTIIIEAVLVLSALVLVQTAQAQSGDKVVNQAVKVATVNIVDAKIISQAGNKINISFDIFNRDDIQPQIRYAVKLMKTENTKQMLMDQKIYGEVFDLGRGETVHKEIEYLAPSYLRGDYQVILEAKNNNGLGLALALAGKTNLQGDGQFLEILTDTCYLSVQGEKDKKYNLIQGVDISAEEILIASCEVKNNFTSSQLATPQFGTYHRTAYGKLISSENQSPVSFQAGEKKILLLAIPKVQNPQAYDAILTLLDANQKPISNTAAFHYVLRGASATIQNVRLNKDFYTAGETANILFDWTGSADSFPGARGKGASIGQATAVLGIKNSKGQACSDAFEQKLVDENQGDQMLRVPIKTDCLNPKVTAQIKDNGGNILDQNVFEFQTSQKDKNAALQPGAEKNWMSEFFLILTILIIILGAVVYYFRRKNKQRLKEFLGAFVFFLLLASAFLWGTQGAKADTFMVDDSTYFVNMNKRVYQPGEVISVTGSAYFGHCTNWLIDSSLFGTINNSQQTFFDSTYSWGDVTPAITKTYVAPTTPGSYDAVFTANSYIGGDTAQTGTYVITYTVASAPTSMSLSFWADPTLVYTGNPSTTLYWNVQNAVSCQATGENRRVANPDQTVKYLGDTNWSSESVEPAGNGPTQKNKNVEGGTINLNGTTYAKGLGTNIESSIKYLLDAKYKRFISDVGIDESANVTRSDGYPSIWGRIWGGYAGDTSKELFNSHKLYISSPTRTADIDVGGFYDLDLTVGSEDNHNQFRSDGNFDWANARLVPETVTDWPDGPRDHTNGSHAYSAKPGNGTTYTLTCRNAAGATITQNVRIDFVREPMGVILSVISATPLDPAGDGSSDGLMDIDKQVEYKFVVSNADGGWWNYPGGGTDLSCTDGVNKMTISKNVPIWNNGSVYVGLDDGWNMSCRNDACHNYCDNYCGGDSNCNSDCKEYYQCTAASWYGLRVVDCSVTACNTPTVTLTANPNPVNAGNASTLTWVTSNATSCWASDGNAGDGWQNTSKAATDGAHSFPVTVTTTNNKTYSIECWNDGGVTTQKKSVTIGLLGVRCAPDTSCAANTCIGQTCNDGCGGTVAGSKYCASVGGYIEVSP